jgi:hypothetical protein
MAPKTENSGTLIKLSRALCLSLAYQYPNGANLESLPLAYIRAMCPATTYLPEHIYVCIHTHTHTHTHRQTDRHTHTHTHTHTHMYV